MGEALAGFFGGWVGYVAAAGLAAFLTGSGIGVLVHKLDDGAIARAQAATQKAQSDLAIETANAGKLSSGLAQCNAGVANAEKAKQESDRAAQAAAKQAASDNARAQKQASAILALKPQGDLCKAADSVILGAVQ